VPERRPASAAAVKLVQRATRPSGERRRGQTRATRPSDERRRGQTRATGARPPASESVRISVGWHGSHNAAYVNRDGVWFVRGDRSGGRAQAPGRR